MLKCRTKEIVVASTYGTLLMNCAIIGKNNLKKNMLSANKKHVTVRVRTCQP